MKNLYVMAVVLCLWAGSVRAGDPVTVVGKDYSFDVVDSIPSGWTTFEFKNEGHAAHFFLLNRLPDSISYETYHGMVAPAFQQVYDSLRAGMSKEGAINLLLAEIPGWYFTDVVQMGGSGIVSMNKSCRVTQKLRPGTYAMECYIKEGDLFHTTLGMITKLVVTGETSKTDRPEADVEMSLSNYSFKVEGAPRAGSTTFAVHYLEHPDLGLGNDVHIVKLDSTTNLDSVAFWLDWMNVPGLQSPAPAEFYGGIQEMPLGETAYFTVDLTPGRYVWIAESSAARGMVKEFTVE